MNATATAAGRRDPPTPRMWAAAVTEVAVAVVVGALLLHFSAATPFTESMPHAPERFSHRHGMAPVGTAGAIAVSAMTALALVWWLARRTRIPAICGAVGLVAVVMSGPVCTLAVQSHLLAMAALEVVLVVAPLLLVSVIPRRPPTSASKRSRSWTIGAIAAGVAFSALLVVLHLPHVHRLTAELTAVPGWLPLLAIVLGTSYWVAILLSAGRVAASVRRTALIAGQEVAAILGLASLFLPSPYLHHTSPLGLSAIWDQRLGGALMVLTCAAVALPLLRRLDGERRPTRTRSELHVH